MLWIDRRYPERLRELRMALDGLLQHFGINGENLSEEDSLSGFGRTKITLKKPQSASKTARKSSPTSLDDCQPMSVFTPPDRRQGLLEYLRKNGEAQSDFLAVALNLSASELLPFSFPWK
ncbi:MAG: hypothetical protein LBS77_00795 [Desulfovibrio sp.]|nr:hypothetical protein [Desulfovibrio sp.]